MWNAAKRVRGRLGATLDDVSEHWIGWTFPPVQRAFAKSHWSPDDSSDYCQRCGDGVGPGEATSDGCGTCRTGGELDGGIGDGVIRLGAYVDPLRGWVHAIKYQRWQEMAEAFGVQLAEGLRASGRIDLARTAVVPMPMPWQRRLYRGIDHALALAQSIARELDAPIARMLVRSNQPPQVGLTSSERKRAGARGMRQARRLGGWPVEGLDLVLVDDVRTTGATLKAAARLLRRAKPARVVCAVIAVSDSRARHARRRDRPRPDSAAPDPFIL